MVSRLQWKLLKEQGRVHMLIQAQATILTTKKKNFKILLSDLTGIAINRGYYYSCGFWLVAWGFSQCSICQYTSSIPKVSDTVPEAILICKQHMNISFQGMLVQSTAQPSAAPADVSADGLQRVEALQLVSVQHFLHIIPEHWLCKLVNIIIIMTTTPPRKPLSSYLNTFTCKFIKGTGNNITLNKSGSFTLFVQPTS